MVVEPGPMWWWRWWQGWEKITMTLHYGSLGELQVLLSPTQSRLTSTILAQTSALGKDVEGKNCHVGQWMSDLRFPYCQLCRNQGIACQMLSSNAQSFKYVRNGNENSMSHLALIQQLQFSFYPNSIIREKEISLPIPGQGTNRKVERGME